MVYPCHGISFGIKRKVRGVGTYLNWILRRLKQENLGFEANMG